MGKLEIILIILVVYAFVGYFVAAQIEKMLKSNSFDNVRNIQEGEGEYGCFFQLIALIWPVIIVIFLLVELSKLLKNKK